MDLLLDLLLALILGMLVGVERGTRVRRSGYDNVIGIRTFGLAQAREPKKILFTINGL